MWKWKLSRHIEEDYFVQVHKVSNLGVAKEFLVFHNYIAILVNDLDYLSVWEHGYRAKREYIRVTSNSVLYRNVLCYNSVGPLCVMEWGDFTATFTVPGEFSWKPWEVLVDVE